MNYMTKYLNSAPDQSPLDSRSAGIRNEKLILQLLRKQGQLSQAQICKQTGLSSSTASYIVARLREKGLVIEETGQSNKRGAKPILLNLNPQGRFAVGIEINPSYILFGLFDFNGRLVEYIKAIASDHTPQTVIDTIEINLRGLLAKHQAQQQRLIGIGITLSGSITQNGMVKLSSPLGWRDVQLKAQLEKVLEIPVSLYTSRVRLLAEMDADPPMESKNILYLNVGNGVGATVYMDGRLLHGATNRSCELGHVIFEPNGPLCGCGQKGCLEALVSGPALARHIKTDLADHPGSLLSEEITETALTEEIIGKWADAQMQRDRYACDISEKVCELLSRAAALAINCYDPDMLILAGYVCQSCLEPLTEAIQKRIETDVYDYQSRQITIMPARVGDQALIRGAATALLNQSFVS